MRTKEILIGGNLVTVPNGYIQAESEYTIKEFSVFETLGKLGQSTELEIARTAVLEKRIEFHALYLSGKIKFEPKEPVKKKTWKSYALWFILGHKWPG